MLGSAPKQLESVVLSKSHFENFGRELLLVRNYCIDIYVCKGGKSDWVVQFQASPGNLVQVEDLLFGSVDITCSAGMLAIKIGQDNQTTVGCCYVDTNERKFLVAQFSDNDSFSNLESLIVQLSPKVYTFTLFISSFYPLLVVFRSSVSADTFKFFFLLIYDLCRKFFYQVAIIALR